MIKKLFLLGAISISFISFAQQQKISIVPSVGYAWRIAETASGLSKAEKDYVKGLKNGLHFDISAYYNLRNIGLGVKFSHFNASSNGFLFGYNNNGMPVSIPVTTKDNITFVGPSLMYSNYNEPTKHKLFFDVAIGVISYTTKTADIKGTGSNLGLDAGVGYQYEVSKNFLIGPKLSVTAGTLNKMTFNGRTVDFGNDQKEGLTRVSLSAAATFRF
ncbi:hypothetical protein SAMN05421786_102352 [Chryseobacterium ureilyticum]|uniref:Outer membrane protein beta-barrel domain-containing protein n=1 Tax=Chryseobacterium ureilyticum TaxID=373668 RepID=A0A1N7M7Z9_9FLAO|nr:hypothetical protein [Chryseobacterium ureilyticum]SIS82194.1 hypothetical protein SAMN05421786_102352 [Chryseobacterium ureilyticum]